MTNQRKGLVLGFYDDEKEGEVTLTPSALGFNNGHGNSLLDSMTVSGLIAKKGKHRVFYGLDAEYGSVAVINLGKRDAGYNEQEEVEEGRENIRAAVAVGVKLLQDVGVKVVHVDPCGDAEAAAEGAVLSLFCYDELKAASKRKEKPELDVFIVYIEDLQSVSAAWARGVLLGEGQNLARHLMESPANVMTPTRFSEIAVEKLSKLPNVTVQVRDKEWAESMKMGGFLGVAKGSDEPPRLVEIIYSGGKKGDAPLAIVGKGITFDSGGISLKPSANMDEMRADMGGAACMLSTIYTVARLGLPINVVGLTPLCENMPSGRANKPGDVCVTMSGKTIQIDNTDAEGRLILSDGLCYAETFKPRGIIDIATLTGAMMIALGASATGVFTHSASYWDIMHKCGMRTGDRVWRMPLFKLFTKQVVDCHLADVNNISTAGRLGGSCTAAAFLKEFVTNPNWMHMDIAGVMLNKSDVSYLCNGMSGRPTRTLIEFVDALSKMPIS